MHRSFSPQTSRLEESFESTEVRAVSGKLLTTKKALCREELKFQIPGSQTLGYNLLEAFQDSDLDVKLPFKCEATPSMLEGSQSW